MERRASLWGGNWQGRLSHFVEACRHAIMWKQQQDEIEYCGFALQ